MSLDQWNIDCSLPNNEPYGELHYKELHEGSGKENYSIDNSSAARSIIVDWDQRLAFLDDLLGYSINYGPGDLVRVLPDAHPDLYNFYCTDAIVEKAGKPDITGNVSSWEKAIINCTYRPLPYALLEDEQISSELDRYVERDYDANVDYLTIIGQMKLVTSGRALQTTPGRNQPYTAISYKWHQVPADPNDPFSVPTDDKITACLGKVNSMPFDGYYAGTVLFMKPVSKMVTPRLGTNDAYYWNIEYKMLIRDYGPGLELEQAGHNYIWDSVSNSYDLVTHDGTIGGNRIYQAADLNQLFVI